MCRPQAFPRRCRRSWEEHSFLAIADGALPGARAQQCWVHKTANVLDKMSQRVRPDAKHLLHEIYLSASPSPRVSI